jgi:hypothetical protein
MIASATRNRTVTVPTLSARAYLALVRTAQTAYTLALEMADVEPEDARAFRDAGTQLRVIAEHLLPRLGDLSLVALKEDRRYALRCVFAWAAGGAETRVARELRRYARGIGVTR